MTDCDGHLHPLALQGLLLFNEGKYFEAHEGLEAAWKEEKGEIPQVCIKGSWMAGVAYLPHHARGIIPEQLKSMGAA